MAKFGRVLIAALVASTCLSGVAHPQAAPQVAPDTVVAQGGDIALSRPGTYRLHDVKEAQTIHAAEQAIGPGASIGDVPGFFTNKVFDAVPTILPAGSTTKALQAALDAASQEPGGGVVRLEAGNYSLGMIDLPSNIRLEIDPGATLHMRDVLLFVAGRGLTAETAGRAPQVINIEITTTDPQGRFTIDASDKEAGSHNGPFLIASAQNFALSNVLVKDNYTILSQVFLVPDADPEVGAKEVNGEIHRNLTFDRCPSFGVVQNIEGLAQHTGYGTVQAFCGTHLLFRDLIGHGGGTLRLEPGSGPDNLNMAGKHLGAMRDIRVENVTSIGGYTALYLKPHSKEIYGVRIDGVHGIDAGFALMVDSGNQNPDDPIFGRGHFHDTRVTGSVTLVKTHKGENSRIGRKGIYFIADSTRAGRSDWEDFPPDPSGERWKTADVIAPVLLASELSADEIGDWHRGFFGIDMSAAKISGESLLRPETVLYRQNARNLDGTRNTDLIEE